MDVFRTIDEIRALDLTDAEEELLRVCELGETAEIGDEVPDASDHDKRIRAGIIRYLMLGGCDGYRPHEKGVRIRGSLIADQIDLEGCACSSDLYIIESLIQIRINLANVKIKSICFDRSICSGIDGHGSNINGSVILQNRFTSCGEVDFRNSFIKGGLYCGGGRFSNCGGISISADRSNISGSVFLCRNIDTERERQCYFLSIGELRFVGAKIGGNLSCDRGAFSNAGKNSISCHGALISGAAHFRHGFRSKGRCTFNSSKIVNGVNFNRAFLCNESGTAIDFDRADTGELFLFKNVKIFGNADLTSAKCGALSDEIDCWPKENGALLLNGFKYRLILAASVDARNRIDWLDIACERTIEEGFWPQPYEQLAKVFREMGHADDARTVLVAKERRQRALRVSQIIRWWAPIWNWLFFVTVGYGYRPFRSLGVLAGLVAFGFVLFLATWWSGAFAPNSPVVLISPEWESVVDAPNPAMAWEAGPGRDYETFNALAYAADIVVPIIDLGQETAWAPSTSRGWIGTFAWWARWALKIMGWIVSALGAAAITGIIRRD